MQKCSAYEAYAQSLIYGTASVFRHIHHHIVPHTHTHTSTQSQHEAQTHESILQICAQLIAYNSFVVWQRTQRAGREAKRGCWLLSWPTLGYFMAFWFDFWQTSTSPSPLPLSSQCPVFFFFVVVVCSCATPSPFCPLANLIYCRPCYVQAH